MLARSVTRREFRLPSAPLSRADMFSYYHHPGLSSSLLHSPSNPSLLVLVDLNRICTPIPLHTRTRPPFRTRSPTLHSSTSVIGNANLHHPISHLNNCKSHFRFTTQPTGSRRDLDIPPLLFHIVHLAYLISRALSLPQTASVRSLSSIKHCDSSHTPARQTSAWSLV